MVGIAKAVGKGLASGGASFFLVGKLAKSSWKIS
jgi:hypothetical protein